MEYILMHKDIPVVDMVIDETGFIAKLGTVYDERRIPIGVHTYASGIDRKGFNDWWLGRSIPASRDGLRDALMIMDVTSSSMLIEKCLGLSLSDQYWICPKGSGLNWSDINFFSNDFSVDVGEMLFGNKVNRQIDFISPDNTSDGWLRKKWIIIDGKRYLMKGGSGVFQQEPFNEVIASEIMERLGIPHIGYSLTFQDDKPFSLCENFVTPSTELVPAWRVKGTLEKVNHETHLAHLVRCCVNLGIPDVHNAIYQMIVIDYIIGNEDRHYNNFGFIRNADTLEWIGPAPIFDSGTSLWYNSPRVGQKIECKPFHSSHEEQLKYAGLEWFDIDKLQGIKDAVVAILMKSAPVDDARRDAIAKIIVDRAETVNAAKWASS
ncbi:MAG: excisionase [Defluviitaleaceae bacterium]|nr:excisionase [Defluviitaleaceae bacterium]